MVFPVKSRTFALVLVLWIGLVGCSGDDENGGTAPPTTGTIVISPQPEGIDAPWEIAGPAGFSSGGNGRIELTNRTSGEYTVTWGDVAGWVTPVGETQNLPASGTLAFGGGYVEENFVLIPPGTFLMGSPEDELEHYWDEGPQHQVTLTQAFYMSKYEVTEELWAKAMGGSPTTSQLPQDYVSWDMAVQFCNALSILEGLTPAYTIHDHDGEVTWNQSANGYRLPTEAEWEYACRATATLAFNNNTNCLSSDTEANYDGNYPLTGCPTGVYRVARTVVGSFPANQWGLCDMHGNMFEWVWCGVRTYTSPAQVDPVYNVGPGDYRVFRSGCWSCRVQYCRSARRGYSYPGYSDKYYGFRPVRTAF